MNAPTRVAAAAGGFAILASSAFLAIRVGVAATTPITLAGLRFFSGAAGFAVLRAFRPDLIRVNFDRRDVPFFLLTGLTGGVIYSLLLIKGQQTASAGTASLIGATVPIWASVIAVTIGRERLPGGAWFGVGLAFLGTLLITIEPQTIGRFDVGAALVLVAALSNAIYFVAVKRLVIRYGALTAVAGTVWAATFLFLPFTLWMEPPPTWGIAAVGSGLFLGLCSTLAGASLFAFVIGRVGAARASTVTYLVAPMVVLMEWLIFGESPGENLLLGGALTLTGLFLVRPRYKRESEMAYTERASRPHPNPTIHVRLAVPSDIPALLAMTRELARFQDLGDRFAATEAGIRAGLFGRHRSAEAVVAEIGNRVVGYAIYSRSFSSTRGAPKLIVEDVFVAPGERGCGAGRELFSAIARRAKDWDAGTAEWSVLRDNREALEFYDSLGAIPAPKWITCTMDQQAIEGLATSGDRPGASEQMPSSRQSPTTQIQQHPAGCR